MDPTCPAVKQRRRWRAYDSPGIWAVLHGEVHWDEVQPVNQLITTSDITSRGKLLEAG